MTTELWYLFLTSTLLTVMWIPQIVGEAKKFGPLSSDEYRTLRDTSDAPLWAHRAKRAHMNLVEQFGAFAGLIVVANLAGISTGLTAIAAAVFFWARLAHAVIMIAGWGFIMIRTLVFTVGFLALLVLAWQILVNAM